MEAVCLSWVPYISIMCASRQVLVQVRKDTSAQVYKCTSASTQVQVRNYAIRKFESTCMCEGAKTCTSAQVFVKVFVLMCKCANRFHYDP